MLKKAHRLSTKQFMEVMEKGRIVTSPLFVMRVSIDLQNAGGISAVAPKKVAPTAALRNKIRRQIYEAIGPLRTSVVPGVSAIVFAKNELVKADFESIKEDLKQLFVKAKISV